MLLRLIKEVEVARLVYRRSAGTRVQREGDERERARPDGDARAHHLSELDQALRSQRCPEIRSQLTLSSSFSTRRLKKEFQITGKDERSFVNGTAKVRLQCDATGGGLSYKLLPYVDQKEMYGSVYTRLKDGGCIGIFPEGEFTSFDVFLVSLLSFEFPA